MKRLSHRGAKRAWSRAGRQLALAALLALAVVSPLPGQTPPPTCFGLAATWVGTSGTDTYPGTPGDDVIVGLGGDDRLTGSTGNDRICGEAGEDRIEGSEGDDMVDGGSDFDSIEGGPGNDTLAGGDDLDLLTFLASLNGIELDLAAGTARGDGVDTLSGFEAVGGSELHDVLVGGPPAEYFFGLGGDDEVRGAGGFDSMLFLDKITADLAEGVATGEGRDTLAEIEGLAGSDEADVLRGDNADNFLLGSEGADRLVGLAGDDRLVGAEGRDDLFGSRGDDTFDGGPEDDTFVGGPGTDDATYLTLGFRIDADLGAGRISGEGLDTTREIESVSGTPFKDVLAGGAGPNSLVGGGGNDTLLGRGGNDVLDGGTGRDRADGGPGRDLCVRSERTERCEPSRAFAGLGEQAVTGLAFSRVHALQAEMRELGARISPAFLRSVLPLATLARVASSALADKVVYNKPKRFPRCVTEGGRHYIEVSPPNEVLPARPLRHEEVRWTPRLMRIGPNGRRPVASAPPAFAVIADKNVPVGSPYWTDGYTNRYQWPYRQPVGPGRYVLEVQINWLRGGDVLRGFEVQPHRQAGESRLSCRFG